jgi:hypothetical protein
MTRQTVVDGASVRETIDALKDVRSVVDVDIYVWQPGQERWWPLTFAQRRQLLDLAHGPPAVPAEAPL